MHTAVTTIQVIIIILSLCVSTMGIVIEHPIITYFWYLSLIGIATMLATSLIIGLVYLYVQLFIPLSTRGGQRWFSRAKGIQS
jgi:hypothetical protein